MKTVIFIGWINKGNVPLVGETVKNQYIIAELLKYCKVIPLDFYQKNRHPWIYLQALWAFITHPKASIVFSTSARNVYSILKVFKAIRLKRHIIHWVVGGAFPQLVKEGRFKASVFNYVSYNLVQCHDMINQLEAAGINNGKYVPNFKRIDYYPDIENALDLRRKELKTRFVYLGRIHPAKGCNYIFQAAEILNNKHLQDKFSIVFYGKLDDDYREEFLHLIEKVENVSYAGSLNLKEHKGYDELSTYDAMLFPTFHPSEGFAGVFIDAFIAGLPVLASDWAYNTECITNGKEGVVFPTHSVESLTTAMNDCIQGAVDLETMARNARREASKHEAKNALNESFLKEIGLIDYNALDN